MQRAELNVLVGALDPSAWTGLVFCTAPGQGFSFRFAYWRNGIRHDGIDFLDIAHEIGPYAPDGHYARIAFDEPCQDSMQVDYGVRSAGMVLEWSRKHERTVVGRLSISLPNVLEFRACFP